jgi:hypothetical protein
MVSAEWLKLSFASDYRGSAHVSVSATAQVTGVVMTEEQRMERIERRKRFLAEMRP